MTRYFVILLQVIFIVMSSSSQVNGQSLKENNSLIKLLENVVYSSGQREDILDLLSNESSWLSSLPNSTSEQCIEDSRFYFKNLFVNRSI